MNAARVALVISAAAAAALFTATPAFAGQCRDPWLTQAIKEVTGRWPNGDYEDRECRTADYNGGHWKDYNELKAAVARKLGSPMSFGGGLSGREFLSLPRTTNNGKLFVSYRSQWWQVINMGGGSYKLINQDGASILTNTSAN